MRLYTPATYHGTGAPVTLAAVLGVKRGSWFRVQPISAGASNGRVGDMNVSISGAVGFTIGTSIEAEAGFFAPPVLSTPEVTEFYDFEAWYIELSNGDTAAVDCGA